MIIEKIEITPLNLKPQYALSVSYGSYPILEYVLIKIHTDDGLVGLGEAAPDPVVTGETQNSLLQTLNNFAPHLTGHNPLNFELIMKKAFEAIPQSPGALAAIDMALYDLIGQALQVPLYQLLGGKSRHGMRSYPVIMMDTPEIMAERAAQFLSMGYDIQKVKVGSDPKEDQARLSAITQAVGPQVKLRLDVNQGWQNAAAAIATIQKLNKFNIEWIEQPIKAHDLTGMAEICRAVDIPIMADESCHSPQDALEIVKLAAADLINIKLMKCGGIFKATQILAICETAGIDCILGSMLESSIGSAAGMHLVTARTNIIAHELLGPLFLQNDPAEGFTADITSGIANITDQPGLGVSLK